MANRHLKDWIASYLDYTKNQESPENLHLWTGLSALSASVKRQVYINRGYYKLYPNIYVIIVAESARIRKSVAMDIGIKLVREAVPDIYYISGSMTPEGLIKHMNRVKVVSNEDKKQVQYDSHVMLCADELAELFGYDKTRALKFTILLTKIYSAPNEHTHTLATEGQLLLRNLYPTLLAATDPRNLKVLPEEAVAGLIGRTIFVTASAKRKPIAWPRPEEEELRLYELLKDDLHTISLVRGEMIPTPEARSIFEQWYIKQSEMKIEDTRLEAFHERCHDTALKLATLIALSRSDDLIITHVHMREGITFIEKQAKEFLRVANWAASSTYAQTRAKFIDMLRRQGGAGLRSSTLKSLNIPLEEMMTLEATLEQEGTITVRISGKNVFYKLSTEELQK